MGCFSSKDVIMTRIKQQEAKIDGLIKINQELDRKLAEIPRNTHNEGKPTSETNDLTNLRSTVDYRFSKIEETVQKMHTELKLKLFEGVIDNLDRNPNKPDESLSLHFDKEQNQQKDPYDKKAEEQTPWKDLLNDSNQVSPRLPADRAYVYEQPGLVDKLPNGTRPSRVIETRSRPSLKQM